MRLLAKEEIPSDWTSKKIGSYVLGHKGGAALRPSDFSDTGFPVIPKKAIQPTGELLIESPTYCTNEFASNNKRSIVDNSYTITTLRDLVPTGPTIGTVVNFASEEKYILSQGVYGLKLNDDLDKKYLSYLSNTAFYRKVMQRIMVGSTQVHIRTPEYLDLEIQIPPLPEQQKIAKILSIWDKAISTTERLIENSTQQKKALMQQLLTGKKRLLDESGKRFEGEWKDATVSSFGKVVTGSTPPKNDSSNYDGNISWATAEDFKRKYVSNTKVKLTESGATKARVVPKGSVLVTCIASIGKNAIANENLATNQQINSVVINKNNSNEFFYYLIEFNTHKLLAWAGTTAVPILNKTSFEKVKFIVPNLKEQQKIATALINADKEIELLEQQLADLQQEKKALMQVLLTGKKRVV